MMARISSSGASLGGIDAAGNSATDCLEDAVIGGARCPERRQVRTILASGISPVARGAAFRESVPPVRASCARGVEGTKLQAIATSVAVASVVRIMVMASFQRWLADEVLHGIQTLGRPS